MTNFYCLDSVPESEPAPGNQTFPKNMAAPRDLTFSLSIRSKMRKGEHYSVAETFFRFRSASAAGVNVALKIIC